MLKRNRIAVVAALCALALGIGGCDTIANLIMGAAVEPRFTGPFLNSPDITQIGDTTPDRITTSSSTINFLWTHPDASDGVPYSCRILTVNVPPAPPNTEVGSVSGTSTPNTIGGVITFSLAPGALLPGTYRAEVLLRGQPFSSVDFEVHAQ